MTAHAITITYDDATCLFTVTCAGLGLTATGPTLEVALRWLTCKIKGQEE